MEDCRQLARDRTGADADATALAPVGTRYILVRMLNNLRSAYFRSKQFDKMVAVTDLLIEAFPRNPEYYKARGIARLRMRQFRSAQKDLETIPEIFAQRRGSRADHAAVRIDTSLAGEGELNLEFRLPEFNRLEQPTPRRSGFPVRCTASRKLTVFGSDVITREWVR